MLRVTIPSFQDITKMISYEAPESAEKNIRDVLISQYPPEVQLRCNVEIIPDAVQTVEMPVMEIPKPQPKTPKRIALETQASELGILGIDFYTDKKLKTRIALKSAKITPEIKETNPPVKKRGRPKKV